MTAGQRNELGQLCRKSPGQGFKRRRQRQNGESTTSRSIPVHADETLVDMMSTTRAIATRRDEGSTHSRSRDNVSIPGTVGDFDVVYTEFFLSLLPKYMTST